MSIYEPGEVSLIGTEMKPDTSPNMGRVRIFSDVTHLLELECAPIDSAVPTMALIYGYMFEGHTYQMAKPRIMVVGSERSDYNAGSSGNGVDPQPTGKLYVWRMNRGEKTVSIGIESGTVEALILEANTPGAGSRASYASHMQTAHRGGKLS